LGFAAYEKTSALERNTKMSSDMWETENYTKEVLKRFKIK